MTEHAATLKENDSGDPDKLHSVNLGWTISPVGTTPAVLRSPLERDRYQDRVPAYICERTLMLSTALRVAAGAALAAGIVTGCSDSTQTHSTAAPVSGPTATPATKLEECLFLPNTGRGAKDVGTPPATPPYGSTVQATLTTNLGAIKLSLDGGKAPCTVASFAHLAGKDFFDGTKCHRLTTGALKVLQCGDPTGTGSGGPAYKYAEENLPKAASGKRTALYAEGTLGMANAGPGTNGSQFFMVYGDSELPPNYTVFGNITSGMDLLQQVAKAGTDNSNGEGDGAPENAVTIQDVTIGNK
ncbi:peptidylprolyl isomerase [Streptomyces xanthophaeus]|uniref:peptidylprolyl isomerase n=1 Tax=Streptomyces xanthophaeus TaxID=67385 RepID=UPI0039900BC1